MAEERQPKRAGLLNAELLPKEEIAAVERALEDELVRIALEAKLASSPDELVVRDILPKTDFGSDYFANDEWVWQAAIGGNTWVLGIKKDLDNDFAVGFYGVRGPRSSTTKTTMVKFQLGETATKDIWHIEQCRCPGANSADEVFGITRSPVVYYPNDTVVVYLYGTGTATADAETLVLLGKVVEPVGRTVQGGVRR